MCVCVCVCVFVYCPYIHYSDKKMTIHKYFFMLTTDRYYTTNIAQVQHGPGLSDFPRVDPLHDHFLGLNGTYTSMHPSIQKNPDFF